LNYICLLRNQNRVSNEVALAEKRFNIGTPQQRAAFHQILDARKGFLNARSAEEPNGTTGMAQAAMQDDIDIDDAWAKLLNKLAADDLPHYSSADFRKIDADLNAAYKAARANADACKDQYCLHTSELVQIERAWIGYRDAWVAYAALRWPHTSADSWRTWLSLEQADDLKNITE
jgi:uncharacterized protein YecT (DUF1311 family)